MDIRRWILLVGAIVLIAGAVGMLVPVSVSGADGDGIGCGNAVAPDLSGARAADDNTLANVPIVNQIVPHTNYVAECHTALGERRMWTIPLALVGFLAMAGALLVPGRPVGVGARQRVLPNVQ